MSVMDVIHVHMDLKATNIRLLVRQTLKLAAGGGSCVKSVSWYTISGCRLS